MKLYNTLTRTVEIVKPVAAPRITVYTCGPTVYDYPHVGNWFTYIREDILIRTLRAADFQPYWVMNITDVGHLVSDADDGEDKLEKGARRENKTAWDVAARYTDYFINGMRRLGMLEPDKMPRATDHITEQISLIQQLESKGYTYTIDDGVYFDTARFAGYADFARLDLDEQQAGARVELNLQKRNPTDFALWKFSPDNHQRDMEWDNPFGNGRKGFPGWHIECSAMSMKYLGSTLDIHAGGIDHVPVHHTNEIAQSEAATGQRFANLWLHGNHITIEGEKISKSLGNGITLEAIEGNDISLEAFRLHVLESHYRSQSKFSWDSLQAAQNRLRDYRAMAALQWQTRDTITSAPSFDIASAAGLIRTVLQDDLNTPLALAELSHFSTELQTTLIHTEWLADFRSLLQRIDSYLGLTLSTEPDITSDQKAAIAQREHARADQDWNASDSIRASLLEQGIELRDTPFGSIWSRR